MSTIPTFGRDFFHSPAVASCIGAGRLGGKAEGLIGIKDILADEFRDSQFAGIEVGIPRMAVLATDVFDAFLQRNQLCPTELAARSDDGIAVAFQQANLPAEVVGDLLALVEEVHTPLAVRSSSALEDALARPFAGVYETKMIPNHQAEVQARFRHLVEAIKLVYASTYFRAARAYRRACGIEDTTEKMAVILQEVVGQRHGDRFYPHLSAVVRSCDYYPPPGGRREEGVAMLALGLGKTIVDGGLCWAYSPHRPRVGPPFGSTRQMLAETQTRFWAVNMGKPGRYDPIHATEYLTASGLPEAEYDGTLRHLVSTYDPGSDRLRPGLNGEGPRVLTFAPLLVLRELPFNELVSRLIATAEAACGGAVEVELAATLSNPDRAARVGFLQVRRMATPAESVVITPTELASPHLLLSSTRCLGNGVSDDIQDIVYTRPDSFQARATPAIASDIEFLNMALLEQNRPYLLIGFGRWGSSDPSLGVPVTWGQVGGARAIVEATLPSMDVAPSQGSHFFHNLSSLGVLYFTVRHTSTPGIDWAWLERQPAVAGTDHVRHVRLPRPLRIRVDGRTGLGMVQHAGDP